MLTKRVIPCLDVRNGRLTKGVKFVGNEDIGDPVETARQYYEAGADEIVFYDITASAEARGIFLDVVEKVASEIFIPFSTDSSPIVDPPYLANRIGEATGGQHGNNEADSHHGHDAADNDERLGGALEALELIQHLQYPLPVESSCREHEGPFREMIYSHQS